MKFGIIKIDTNMVCQNILKKDFEKYVKRNNYTAIVSHNIQGEYGHPQHQDVSRLAYKTAKKFGILFGSFNHGKRLPKILLKEV